MRISGLAMGLMAIVATVSSALEHENSETSSLTPSFPNNRTAEGGIFQYSSEADDLKPFPGITRTSPTELATETIAPSRYLPDSTRLIPAQSETIVYTIVSAADEPILTPGPNDIDTRLPYLISPTATFNTSGLFSLPFATQLPEITINVKNSTAVTSTFATHVAAPTLNENFTINPNVTKGTTSFTSPTAVSGTAEANSPAFAGLVLIVMICVMSVGL